VNVHHVADDERTALMAAQNAGGEGPRDLQITHVVAVDLRQAREARIRVVTSLQHPAVRVGLQGQHAVVGEGDAAHSRTGEQTYQEFLHVSSMYGHPHAR
jgi:hypothetical protein